MLNERYGKLDIIIDAHYSKSRNISLPIYKQTSLPPFYNKAEKQNRPLKSLEQDVNHTELLMMLKSKKASMDIMDYGILQKGTTYLCEYVKKDCLSSEAISKSN